MIMQILYSYFYRRHIPNKLAQNVGFGRITAGRPLELPAELFTNGIRNTGRGAKSTLTSQEQQNID